MEDDDESDAKTGKFHMIVDSGFDRSGQCQAVEQRVQGQAERGSDPGKLLGRFAGQRVRVMFVVMVVVVVFVSVAAIFRVSFRRVVMMKMEKALDKKHCQEAPQHPGRRPVNRMQLFGGIRQKMQQRDAEHQSGNKADGDLQTRVSWVENQQKPAARQRGQQDQ